MPTPVANTLGLLPRDDACLSRHCVTDVTLVVSWRVRFVYEADACPPSPLPDRCDAAGLVKCPPVSCEREREREAIKYMRAVTKILPCETSDRTWISDDTKLMGRVGSIEMYSAFD